ncbi:hypothetical protein AB6Q56_10590 [Dechloromonas sp. ARDL1]|uniref:hypothetical protein n=1 Tax=Dechloromonas sp. ARDL1 TaxID=3322121 RepID=UPI003DA72051
MLAPLKDRSVLARSGEDDDPEEDTETMLRNALREARQALRRAATRGVRQTVALTNDINRLSEENRQLRQRLEELENGQSIVALGQQLMALRAENDALIAAARRVCDLNHGLRTAHGECERLRAAREQALDHLQTGIFQNAHA